MLQPLEGQVRPDCGLIALYYQRSARICASDAVVNSSVLRNSSRNRPLKDFTNPFSLGIPAQCRPCWWWWCFPRTSP